MSNFYDSYNDSSINWSKSGRALFIVIVVIVVIILFGSASSNWITEEKAMERFVEITGTTDIVIVRSSNMIPFFGNPNDVTFELQVDGKNVSARCTSGTFSPMVCRVYTGDE